MKSGAGVVRLAWILLGLLAIGSAAFELSTPQTKEEPYASSFDPSGSSAFVELLRRDGYQVQIDTVQPPSVRNGALAIAFVARDEISLPIEAVDEEPPKNGSAAQSSDKTSRDDENPFSTGPKFAPPTIETVVAHLAAGGNAIVLGYDPKADLKIVAAASPAVVSDPSGRKYKVAGPSSPVLAAEPLDSADAMFQAWTADRAPVADLNQIGDGRAVTIGEGEMAMNAFIDQGDNAKLLLDQVHLLAPKGSRVEVIDGSISGATAGLIDALGPWAHGVQLQVILVGVVIVYSLGKRFGLADETLRFQPGARDLLDGIADTYNRGRAGKACLQEVLQDADRAVRRQLKLASDAPLRKRNDLLPPAVAQALTACEHAMMQDPTPVEALGLARHLETELELFLRRRAPAAKRKRRSVNSA